MAATCFMVEDTDRVVLSLRRYSDRPCPGPLGYCDTSIILGEATATKNADGYFRSIAIGAFLRERTGLPIDFQIQRQTEANEKHRKPRNPMGTERTFAGGGDGTPTWKEVA